MDSLLAGTLFVVLLGVGFILFDKFTDKKDGIKHAHDK